MKTIQEYIADLPVKSRIKLEELRNIIKICAPELTEEMKWGKIGYTNDVIMIIIAGYKDHVSIHLTKTTIEALKSELKNYVVTSGGVQFTVDKPLPIDLINNLIKYRLDEYKENKVLWRTKM